MSQIPINAPLKGPPPLSDLEKERRKRLIEETMAQLAAAREALKAGNLQTPNGLLTALRFCGAHDRAIKKIHTWASRLASKDDVRGQPMALVAQGGYGRRQLNLFSDIDLLFLLPSSAADRAELELRLILYVLFDLKVEIGHAARTLGQALDCVGIDLDSTTALIDTRFLAGNRRLYDEFRRQLARRLRGEGRRWLLREVVQHREQRHQKHGSSVYILQPNVREGEGGLRDLHAVSWLSFAAFGDGRLRALAARKIWTPAELREARNGRAFLLRLRNELHSAEGRRIDLIRLVRQNALAVRLGYKGDPESLPEEQMLREHYVHARAIHDLTDSAINRFSRMDRRIISGMMGRLRQRRLSPQMKALGQVAFLDDRSADWLRRNPRNILAAAALAAEHGLHFSQRTRERVRRAALRIDEEFRTHPENRDSFLRILASPAGMAAMVRTLHDTKVLEAYLPEWAHLFCLVHSDLYHAYTVDEHHLKCLEASERLRTDPAGETARLQAAAASISRWDLLNLSLLLHDVGKGLGGAHALRGAQIADGIALRIGLRDEDRDLLRFLVRSHLKMSHAAQRRDLLDDRVIQDFAREVGDLERLRMLYVHTVCDFRGVGPNAYTDWRAQVLGLLYDRAEMVLRGQPLARPERPRIQPALREGILQRLGRAEDTQEVDRFLDSLPDRYIATATPDLAADHFALSRRLTEANRVEWLLHDEEKANYSELRVASFDVPGFFSNICGAMAAKDVNILSAQVYSTTDGFALDTLQITDPHYNRLPEGFRLDRLKRHLNEVLLGRRDIAGLIEGSRRPKRVSRHRLAHRPSRVEIDNASSDAATIIEIYANDRTGLLYDITRVLYERGLSIDLAMIATASYQVVDVLYVTDVEGNKVYGDSELESLTQALLAAIAGEADGDSAAAATQAPQGAS